MWTLAGSCAPVKKSGKLIHDRTTRSVLVQDFDRPEARIRATVFPDMNTRQSSQRPRALRSMVEIHATRDSAVIVVTRQSVPESELRQLFGDRAWSLDWYFAENPLRILAPLVSYFEHSGHGRNVVDSLHIVRIETARRWPLGWQEDTQLTYQAKSKNILIVRPGAKIRIRTYAHLSPPGVNEDSRYRAHYEWFSVPAPEGTRFRCGEFPQSNVFATPGSHPDCNAPSGFPAVRNLDARTKMIRPSLAYGTAFVAVLGGAVWVIAHSR